MGNRHKAREFTLQILFSMDFNKQDVEQAIELFWQDLSSPPEVRRFSDQLVIRRNGSDR